MTALLSIRNLNVYFNTRSGLHSAVKNFSLDIGDSEVLSVVGESGSGKSVAMLAFMDLLGKNAVVEADSIHFDGIDWLSLPKKEKRTLLGRRIGMIFQEPITSLNPCFKVGWQIAEKVRLFGDIESKHVRKYVLDLFKKVGITDASSRYDAYPHQFSGGMNQRVMIAMAISCKPKLIIADEPTTALDVTIQAQILDLLKNLQKSDDMGLILITHNMGIVAEYADNVLVQYAGEKVEKNNCRSLLTRPLHPYTKGLLDSLPERNAGDRLKTIPGGIPPLNDKPAGCIFHPRCAHVREICRTEPPPETVDGMSSFKCHFPLTNKPTVNNG